MDDDDRYEDYKDAVLEARYLRARAGKAPREDDPYRPASDVYEEVRDLRAARPVPLPLAAAYYCLGMVGTLTFIALVAALTGVLI